MIEARRAQRSFGDKFITAEIKDLQEPWMTHVDAMLADEAMVELSTRHWCSDIPKAASKADRRSDLMSPRVLI